MKTTNKTTTKTSNKAPTSGGTTTTKTSKVGTGKAKRVVPTKAAVPEDITTIADSATSALGAIAATIPTDLPTGATPSAWRAGTRVPDQAMSIAEGLLTTNQSRFPDLSGTVVSDALAYEAAMAPFVLALDRLSAEITTTIRERRMNAAQIALGLYKALQTLAKIAPTTGFPAELAELAALLRTVKKTRATSVTKTEAQAAVKAVKVKKVAANNATNAAAAAAAAGGAFVPTASAAPVQPVVPLPVPGH